MAFQISFNFTQKWSVFGAHLSLRRMFCPTGIIRQKSTESSVAFCRSVLERVIRIPLHSVHLTHSSPPGIPLSAVSLRVSKGPSMNLGELAPSLVTHLEAAATNGCQDNGPRHEAFEVLEKALGILTDPADNFGFRKRLSGGFVEWLNNKLKERSVKEKKAITEAMINMEIATHILLHLTKGYIIVNKSHSKNLMADPRIFLPEAFILDGLALGHIEAWYGELDMLICPHFTGKVQRPSVAVLCEKSERDKEEDAEEDCIEEGYPEWAVPRPYIAVEGEKHVPDSWSLFGRHFSQAFATAVTFSYVYHYTLLGGSYPHSSLLPTIQISPKGYQIFIYDCKQDVMLANNFVWNRASLINLWAFIHYHLFFPTTFPQNLANRVGNFGCGQSSPFYAHRSDLMFGLSASSSYWRKVEPEEGRMLELEEF